MPEPVADAATVGRATADGASLHYEVAGSGPTVVLIHSGITDSRSWDPQMPEFRREFQTLRYDMRGFGRSDTSHGEYSPRADLEAVLDAAGLPRAALLGVSMGSSLAVDFALEHPERVTALVLVGPGISGRSGSEAFTTLMGELDRVFDQEGDARGIERELEIWLYGRGRTAADVDPKLREAVFEMDSVNSARLPADMKARPLSPPAIGRLGEIGVPTLIVVGDRDLDDVFDAADRLQAGIKGSSRVTMQGTAHVPNMEQPQEFNRTVLEFLRGAVARQAASGR